ncbi:sigma-70 family RNA polymerase sigma factor [Microbacterium sp. SSM24]|uniref:sigma-70 family RNA polymerase sigma factor n=1 Tax=Microbacterium sp. SSM24 TaxID=2991714 RepID=UPI0022262A38|nr:sigma-70 family RNA polymerase sigma factor [Microbacterium sp. SSM24]MCW3494662.1 sigma-70 family RNA polymerase sigma factor [Microbacterium sp. SSM24]
MITASSIVVDGPQQERSDEELVLAARAGDDDAYAMLWRRHVTSARNAARAVSPNVDADDLVSEAFAAILSAIRKGGGPQEGFRPYLFATIRNIAATWGRRTTETPLDDLDERAADVSTEFAELVADRSVLAQAFRELPAQWRTLLWYLEVEGMKPREVAPLLGISPNAVSAQAYRAREGFKLAWLRAHISDQSRPAECRWVGELLVASERKAIKRADRRRLDEHLRKCAACRIVAADIDHVSQKLRLVLLPLVLGGAGALAYTADATPAMASTIAGTSEGGGRMSDAAESGAGGAHGGGAGLARAGAAAIPTGVAVIAGMGLAAALAVGTVVMAGTAWHIPAAEPRPAQTAPAEHERDDPPAATPDTTEAVGRPPVPQPIAPPAPPSTESTLDPAPVPAPVPSPAPVRTPPAPNPPVIERTATASLDEPGDLAAAVPAPFTGIGVPEASVTLLDETGAVLAVTCADRSGRFAAIVPGDLLRDAMTIRAVQTARGLRPSEPSAAVGPLTVPAPSVTMSGGVMEAVLSDLDLDGEVDDLTVLLSGLIGQTVAVAVDGVWTGNLHVLAEEPLPRAVLDLSPGTHVLAIRYVDPATGREGRVATFGFEAING